MGETSGSSVPAASAGYALQQYQAYMQDLGNVGTRYATSNGFYLSIVTALLGIFSFAKAGESLASYQSVLRLAVPLFAALVCWVWFRTLVFYKALFRTKFTVLREIEKSAGLFPMYERDYKVLKETGVGGLVDKEAWVARLLMALFLIMFGVALVMH